MSTDGRTVVTDRDGNPRGEADAIQPGDRIHVVEDSLAYNFNRYFPVVGSVVSVVATAMTIVQIVVTLAPR